MNHQTSVSTQKLCQHEDRHGETLQLQTQTDSRGSRATAAPNTLWRNIISNNADLTESTEDLNAQRPPQEGESFLTVDELRARYCARLAARRVAA